MLVWLVDLRKTESPADEWISRGEKIRNDLQCEGTSFVDSNKRGPAQKFVYKGYFRFNR